MNAFTADKPVARKLPVLGSPLDRPLIDPEVDRRLCAMFDRSSYVGSLDGLQDQIAAANAYRLRMED